MSNPKATNTRRHRFITDRNLLIGFFALLLLAGGGLIYLFYGGWAAGAGLLCIVAAAGLVGVVFLILMGLGRLSDWLDSR